MAEDEPEKAAPARPHRLSGRVAIAVGLIAFVVFLPSLMDGFVFDDRPLITGNEYVHALKWVPRAFATHLWDVSPLAVANDLNGAVDTTRRYYRPLITLSHLLTWVVAGRHAWPYHLTNIVAHALTAWLATRAAIRWTHSVRLGGVIGLVFALHPTRAENVLWISGRMDVFMLLFGLLAVEGLRREKPRAMVLGALALVAALLCKEPAVMLPFVLLADRPRRGGKGAIAITTAICGGYGLVRMLLMPPGGDIPHVLTPKAFVFTVGVYAERALAPWPPAMFYEQVPHDGSGHPLYAWPQLVFGGVMIAAGLVALAYAWRRDRPSFWLLVAVVAFLGPLLNVYLTGLKDIAQDRFLYAPLLFALVAVARLAKPRLVGLFRRRVTWLAVAGVALGAAFMIELRTLDFRDDASFWQAELAQSERDPYVLRMNGALAATSGDLHTALSFYRRSATPEAARYESTSLWVSGHFSEAAILGATLPDGDIDALRALEGELYRSVDPRARIPPRAVVLGVSVGGPLPTGTTMKLQESGVFRWDAALLATRVGDFALADDIVTRTNASRAASSPLNGVLVLARLGRNADARALLAELRRVTSLEETTNREDFDAVARRLQRSEAMGSARDSAKNGVEAHAYDALRLAELGAYWSALRVVVAAKLQGLADTAELTLQLLVACRFDDAAKTFAARFDSEGLRVKIFADLPPAVRAMEPSRTPLDQVLARAARPL